VADAHYYFVIYIFSRKGGQEKPFSNEIFTFITSFLLESLGLSPFKAPLIAPSDLI